MYTSRAYSRLPPTAAKRGGGYSKHAVLHIEPNYKQESLQYSKFSEGYDVEIPLAEQKSLLNIFSSDQSEQIVSGRTYKIYLQRLIRFLTNTYAEDPDDDEIFNERFLEFLGKCKTGISY